MSVITQPVVVKRTASPRPQAHAQSLIDQLPARLLLAPAGCTPGRLDGAWWPRSRDLAAELPFLTDALDRRWGRITRVAVNPSFWAIVPRKVPVNGHVVHVGWFSSEQDPHDLLLLSYTSGRWDLLVIPPETAPAAAARLMTAAADPHGTLTAGALMAADEARVAAEDDTERQSVWESEGGPVAVRRETPTGM